MKVIGEPSLRSGCSALIPEWKYYVIYQRAADECRGHSHLISTRIGIKGDGQ